MTEADRVWNRACHLDLLAFGIGDRALWAMLNAHGLSMNGGVLHAVELLSAEKLAAAIAGYQFYGFPSVAELMQRARKAFEAGRNLEEFEVALDHEYAEYIRDDEALGERFESRFREHPEDFEPL
jgi:hypothetical protein